MLINIYYFTFIYVDYTFVAVVLIFFDVSVIQFIHFHFDTTGKIYGSGFGPKYFVDNTTNLSIRRSIREKKFQTKNLNRETHIFLMSQSEI